MNPYESLNHDRLSQLDPPARMRYLRMLDIPEPDWQDIAVRMVSYLKGVRDSMAEHDENTVISLKTFARLIDQMLKNPQIAGPAYEFLEQTKQAVDVIALEQLLSLDADTTEQ